jgi:hypothetical protein
MSALCLLVLAGLIFFLFSFPFHFISFFLLVELGFEVGFALAKQALYHLSHTSSPFYSGSFRDGVKSLSSLSEPPK